MKIKNRIIYLDLIRIFALLLIILIHSPIPHKGEHSLLLGGISFLSAPSIGLFFMVSGALLLPVKTDMNTFLKKRMGKVIGPTVFFSLFYTIVNYTSGQINSSRILHSIISIPFSVQGHGVLWFMYAIVGLYLISPIISPWIKQASQKEIEFVLLLWGITMSYPILKYMFQVDDGKTSMLYYFNGYAGYYLLGYYFHHYHQSHRIKWVPLFFFIPICTAFIIKRFQLTIDFYELFWNLCILTVLMSVGWFYIIQVICHKYQMKDSVIKWTANISDSCFGIYLVHIFIMRHFLWKVNLISHANPFIQIFLTTVLTFLLSFLVVQVVRRLPYGQFIVGVGK